MWEPKCKGVLVPFKISSMGQIDQISSMGQIDQIISVRLEYLASYCCLQTNYYY